MGLIKTGLKAAVAVKTAHYVHDRIERRQQAQWAAAQGHQVPGVGTAAPLGGGAAYATAPWAAPLPDAPAQPVVPPGGGQDRSAVLSQLKDLAELRAAGVLTEEEVAQQKALILGG